MHWRHSLCLPGEPGSSKGSRRAEIAQAAASATQFMPARRTLISTKDPRRPETAQAAVVGGTDRTYQENLGRVKP